MMPLSPAGPQSAIIQRWLSRALEQSLHKRSGTYVYATHGVDITRHHKQAGRVARKERVPEGCTYSTIVKGGECSTTAQNGQLTTIAMNPGTRELLTDPMGSLHPPYFNYDVVAVMVSGFDRHKASIPDMDGMHSIELLQRGTFHFREAGKPYTEKSHDFFLAFDHLSGIGHYALKSGLYDIERYYDRRIKNKSVDFSPEQIHGWNKYIPPEGITLSDILDIYEGSIFPTPRMVHAVCTIMFPTVDPETGLYTYDMIHRAIGLITRKVKQSTLFRMFPGNHYDFSCRSYDREDSVPERHMRTARRRSVRAMAPTPLLNTFKARSRVLNQLPRLESDEPMTFSNIADKHLRVFNPLSFGVQGSVNRSRRRGHQVRERLQPPQRRFDPAVMAGVKDSSLIKQATELVLGKLGASSLNR